MGIKKIANSKAGKLIILGAAVFTLAACQKAAEESSHEKTESTNKERTKKEEPKETVKVNKNEPKKITAEEAYKMMNGEEPVTIVDVRTMDEYVEKTISNSILIPNETIGDTEPEMLPVKDAKILVYCRSGSRSAQAAKKLSDMGYTNIYDFGGINDWPYETVPGAWHDKSGSFSSFRSTDIYGAAVDENIFKDNKLTMVNIWATYCGPCLQEMPELGLINEEYKNKGFEIVGIVSDTTDGTSMIPAQIDKAREIAEKTGANYKHILPTNDLMKSELAKVAFVPTTLFVNSKGEVVGEEQMGSKSKSEWELIIDEKLKEAE